MGLLCAVSVLYQTAMLLKKFDENKEGLKQIGREAIAESRRLGLPLSTRGLKNQAECPAKHAQSKRVSAA